MVSGAVVTGIFHQRGNTLYTSKPGGAWMSDGATGNNNGTITAGLRCCPEKPRGGLGGNWGNRIDWVKLAETFTDSYFFQRIIIELLSLESSCEVILMKYEPYQLAGLWKIISHETKIIAGLGNWQSSLCWKVMNMIMKAVIQTTRINLSSVLKMSYKNLVIIKFKLFDW